MTPTAILAAGLAATAGYLADGRQPLLVTLLGVAVVTLLIVVAVTVVKTSRSGGRSDELRTLAVEARADLSKTRAELAGAQAEVTRLAERLRQAEAAAMAPTASGRQVEVFVNLSRRLQSLVHREIKLLDALENEVEDPDLLKGLFQVDHLATRIRRHAENLAVLGGSVSRRQWSRPVALTEVLRSAIAEVEHYSRVKLVPPIDGSLPGHAVSSVIHLIAELIENATMFAPPHTQVLLRAQPVAAGVAIEVEDRGLGMQRIDQHRVNQLLSNPDHINLDELLSDGRIGLYVVSVIARQHGILVQLQTNIYGGMQAIVILPLQLLGDGAPQQFEVPGRPAALDEMTTEIPRPSAWPVTSSSNSADSTAVSSSATAGRSGSLNGSSRFVSAPVSAMPLPASLPGPALSPTNSPTVNGHVIAPRLAPPGAPADETQRQASLPPLPRRRSQTHLAPQLRAGPFGPPSEPAGEHNPGLMASFMNGVSQGEATPAGPDSLG